MYMHVHWPRTNDDRNNWPIGCLITMTELWPWQICSTARMITLIHKADIFSIFESECSLWSATLDDSFLVTTNCDNAFFMSHWKHVTATQSFGRIIDDSQSPQPLSTIIKHHSAIIKHQQPSQTIINDPHYHPIPLTNLHQPFFNHLNHRFTVN